MSCEECENEQRTREKEIYFRIGNGNVLVFACDKHAAQLQRIIRGELK